MSIFINGMQLPKDEVAVIIYSDGDVRTEDWTKYSAIEVPDETQPVKWIPVTERLPDFEGCLLCMRKTVFGLSVQEVLYYEDGEFSYNGIDNLTDGAVTHWMPLPKPPKDGET